MLNYQRVNLHFPMVFLWFSYGFPIKTSILPEGISYSISISRMMVMSLGLDSIILSAKSHRGLYNYSMLFFSGDCHWTI